MGAGEAQEACLVSQSQLLLQECDPASKGAVTLLILSPLSLTQSCSCLSNVWRCLRKSGCSQHEPMGDTGSQGSHQAGEAQAATHAVAGA